MRPPYALRRRLAWKLLASYVVVVLVGVVVLAGTAELLAPSSLQRHVDSMAALEGAPVLARDLHDTFHASVEEVLLVATTAALAAAVVVSLFTTRRITGPVQEMALATRRIAAGDYGRRLDVDGEDELSDLAKAFNLLAESLEQTERRRMALISDVAHELRTPLTNLRSLVESVADGVVDAGPDVHVAMGAEVARMQRLVGDLEELSRAEAGALRLEVGPVDLAAVVGGCVERLRGQFVAKGVDIDVSLPPTSPVVRGDAGRLTQVLMNLVGNALQYTPPGGSVHVTLRPEADRVVVSVADTGIGISSESIHRVFERFYRVDPSRSRSGGGSGLGLAIARHFVEAHGGVLTARSAGPGQGSEFAFWLPAGGHRGDYRRRQGAAARRTGSGVMER